MARNTKESALIVHRHGKLSEMPHALNEAEIGLASDENRIFMGNPKHVDLASREEFPYQNIEILTEFSNVLDYIKYRYTNNIQSVDGEFNREFYQESLPIIVEGTTEPDFSVTITLTLSNGQEVSEPIVINAGSTLQQAIDLINAIKDETHIFAENYNGKLVLVGYDKELSLAGTNIQNLGLATTEVGEVLLPYRKINEKLDDILSVKDYAYKSETVEGVDYYSHIDGDGTTNVGSGIYNAIIGTYAKSDDVQFKRNLFFPSGKYVIGEVYSSFPILNGMSLVGEGMDRTVLYVTNADLNTKLFQTKEKGISNVTFRDMTIDCSQCVSMQSLIDMVKCSDVIFENVNFIGNCNYALSISDVSKNITFKGCIFKGFNQAIYSNGSLTNVNIIDCVFNGYSTYALNLVATSASNYIKGCKIYGNTFTNGGSDYAIRIDGNGTVEYNTIINNTYDKEVVEQLNNKKPLNSSKFGAGKKNYTDIVDPTTDTRKALLFNFLQPRWDYIQYLKSTGDNITFETDNEHIVVIEDNGVIPYEERIADVENAVPTVKFVKDMSQGGMNITEVTYQNVQNGVVPLALISDEEQKFIELYVNVVKPFGKVYSYLNNACEYTNGLTYYNGDIVKQTVSGTVKYGVVVNKHQAGSSIINSNVVLVESGLTDIKYADIVAIKDGDEYTLTRCGINNELAIDLQALDDNEYTRKSFTEGNAYNGIVSHLDKLYKVNMGTTQSTVANLHNTTLSKQLNVSGYKYVFDFDRLIVKNDELINTSDINLNGYKIVMRFYDSNGNIVNMASNKNLNPSGKMIIGIRFNKNNETPIVEIKNYIETDGYEYTNIDDMVTLTNYIGSGNVVIVPTIRQE